MAGLFCNREQRWNKSLLAAFFYLLSGLCLAFFPSAAPAQRFLGGETRSLKIYFVHTQEKEDVVFKKNGRYVRSGLKRLNYLLRDWRRNEAANMDPRLFDLVWQIYQLSGSKDYIHAVSGYRSPQTNAMLRLSSPAGGVAKHSRHMEGKAMDFYLPDVNLAYLRAIALKLQGGGIGYYPVSGSPFVHIDVGGVRHWPRMSRPALAALFPDGRTLHVPADGRPLAHYAEAEADYKERGATALPVFSTRALFGGLLPRQVILAAADGHLPVGRSGAGNGMGYMPPVAPPLMAQAAPPAFIALAPVQVPVPVAAPHFNMEAEEADDEADIKTSSIPVPQFKYEAGVQNAIGALMAYAPANAVDNAAAGAALEALIAPVPVPGAKPLQAAAGAEKAKSEDIHKSGGEAQTADLTAPLPQPKPLFAFAQGSGGKGRGEPPNVGQDAVGALIAQNNAMPFRNIPLPLEKMQKGKKPDGVKKPAEKSSAKQPVLHLRIPVSLAEIY